MPGNAPPTNGERAGLLGYLGQQRAGLKYAAYGLTEDQLRARPTRSELSIGGLLKHGAVTERGWTDLLAGGSGSSEDAYVDSFVVGDDQTRDSLIALVDEVAAETEAAVGGLESLDVKIQLPPAPWFPDNPDGYEARWILLHLVEELARHAGHADIIREQIDGATMWALMAAAEGWPETEWVKPWKPSA